MSVVEAATERLTAAKHNRALPDPKVIVPGAVPRRAVVVKLVGGPCDGTYATILGFGVRCWQRIPGNEPVPYFACYTKDFTTRGVFEFASDEPIVSAIELAGKMAAQQARDGEIRVMGSYGA